MDINFVSRDMVKTSRTRSSKYKPLLEAIKKLEAGGKALEVSYEDEAELNAMRNVVYSHNKKNDDNIRSSKRMKENLVYFYKEEA